ncbi:MAG: hypothetical protein HY865_07025 [Chloroflexi bacterium]|nr:hypothetical protein [Chloroflexota bacterium]
MKLSTNTILIFFGILALGMMALFPISLVAAQVLGRQPDKNPQTDVQAMVTQTMLALTANAPTQTPVPPTPIVVQVTSTPVPTATSLPAATQVTYCDWAFFVKDVTIPDGTVLAPGETFTKIWRLKNRGTCTWTSDYMLVFSSGSQMDGKTVVTFPGNVAPGQTVDVSILLTAPSVPGSYSGYWMLRNSSGALFGTGDKANIPFYVDIQVKQPANQIPHGTVGGNLCYPSEFNPPLTLYFENAHTGEKIQFAIPENENVYSVLLPAGRYYVYAWAPNYNLEGAYTDSNGLMKTFLVEGGLTTPFINLCDWSPNPHGREQ